MVAKVAGGIVGLGLISTGSIAFAKPEWLGLNKEIPWKPLSQDSDFTGSETKTSYDNKFGSTYKYYLVGATSNEDWWKESFERLKQDTNASKKFKYSTNQGTGGIIKEFSTTESDKALNQICKKVYKSEATNIKSNAADSNDSEYKEVDVWKYCSGLGEKPKTIAEVDTESKQYQDKVSDKDPIGKDTTNRQKLVSTKGNDLFWEIRDKEFKGKDNYEKIEGSAVNAFFKEKGETTIRQLCEQAYGKANDKTTDTEAEVKKDTVIKYCSLEKK